MWDWLSSFSGFRIRNEKLDAASSKLLHGLREFFPDWPGRAADWLTLQMSPTQPDCLTLSN